MRIKGKWLTFFIGVPLFSTFLGAFCAYAGFILGDLRITMVALIGSLVLGVAGLIGIVLRNDIIKLDAYDGLLVQYVDGTGRVSIVPGYIKNGEVYTKDSDFPICAFDRDKYVFSFIQPNPGEVHEVAPADAIFKIAGKPLIIVDRVTMVPMRKSALTAAETEYQSLHAIRNIAAVVKNLSGRISGLEAAVAAQMTGGMRGWLGRWGVMIALIIIAIGIAFAIVFAVLGTGSGHAAPPQSIITPR